MCKLIKHFLPFVFFFIVTEIDIIILVENEINHTNKNKGAILKHVLNNMKCNIFFIINEFYSFNGICN